MPLFTKFSSLPYETVEREQKETGIGRLLRFNEWLGLPYPFGGYESDVTTLQQVQLPKIRQITTIDDFVADRQPGTDLRNFEKPTLNVYDARQRNFGRGDY